jgi:hypothetical protein
MRQALQALENAQTVDTGLDLSAAINQLVLSARSVAVNTITQAIAVASKPNELRKITEAQALVSTGDAELVLADYTTALNTYGDAVKKVQNLIK